MVYKLQNFIQLFIFKFIQPFYNQQELQPMHATPKYQVVHCWLALITL